MARCRCTQHGASAGGRLYSRPDVHSLSDNPTVPLRAALVAVQLPDVDDDAFAASVAELGRLGRRWASSSPR